MQTSLLWSCVDVGVLTGESADFAVVELCRYWCIDWRECRLRCCGVVSMQATSGTCSIMKNDWRRTAGSFRTLSVEGR